MEVIKTRLLGIAIRMICCATEIAVEALSGLNNLRARGVSRQVILAAQRVRVRQYLAIFLPNVTYTGTLTGRGLTRARVPRFWA